MTPEARDKMKTLNERDSFELLKQVSLKGKGCNEQTFPEGWKDKCGDASLPRGCEAKTHSQERQ